MLRLYRQVAEDLLLILLFVRDSGMSLNRIRDSVGGSWRTYNPTRNPHHTERVCAVVNTIFDNGQLEEGLNEMIETLADQLHSLHQGRSSSGSDKDLIDTVVKLLQLPYLANRIGAESLAALKKAVLLPDEVISLKERLSREEMYCAACGHKFMNHEIGLVSSTNGKAVVNCTVCRYPEWQAAGCGKHSMLVSKSVLTPMKKAQEITCHDCEREAAEVVEARADGLIRDIPDTIGRVTATRPLSANTARRALEGFTTYLTRDGAMGVATPQRAAQTPTIQTPQTFTDTYNAYRAMTANQDIALAPGTAPIDYQVLNDPLAHTHNVAGAAAIAQLDANIFGDADVDENVDDDPVADYDDDDMEN